ncbi:hypothetical protein ACLOJK_010744 [Asimina triloba]
MAATLLPHFKLNTILSITLTLALLANAHLSFDDPDMEDDEEYVVDNPFHGLNLRSGSRFLATTNIKKGLQCEAGPKNICSGVSVNNGTGLLQCCKEHCRDVLSDRDNCGVCGRKCSFGQLCCNGQCTDIAYNVDHCGKCDKKCKPGVKCEYGVCGRQGGRDVLAIHAFDEERSSDRAESGSSGVAVDEGRGFSDRDL